MPIGLEGPPDHHGRDACMRVMPRAWAILVAVVVLHPPVVLPQEPVGATARCRDGSYSFSSTPCTERGGVAEVLAFDWSVVHPDNGAPEEVRFEAAEARHHGGEVAAVCGIVASARFIASMPGQPTFLDLDRPYPDGVFTIVIWGTDRMRFPGRPEEIYRDQRICASGRIDTRSGAAQLIVRSPNAVKVGS